MADLQELSKQLEELAHRLWPEVVASIDALVARAERMNEWRTVAGSPLAGDDAAAQPYQTSHALQHLLTVGIDSLNGVRHLIWGRPGTDKVQPVLHQAAHYVLARAAIENFATALWLIGPTRRPERVVRTLRWHVQNAKDKHKAFEPLGVAGERPLSVELDQLEEMARSLGVVPKGFRQGYTATEVLRYADETNPNRDERAFLSVQMVWQLCSGFAHGRQWASLAYQERETLPTDDPEILSVRMTSNMHRALVAPKEALHLLERLLTLHEARNRPLY